MSTATSVRQETTRCFGWFIRWVVLSSFGSGLVYPYTALYLVTRTSVGTGGSAAYFGVVAIVNFLTSLALGTIRVRFAPGLLGGVGYLVLVLAYVSLGAVHGLSSVLLVAAAVGVGRGVSGSGISPFVSQLAPEEQQRDAFGRRYQAMNIGLAVGLLSASLLLTVLPPSVLPAFFVVNGLSFLPAAWFMINHRGVAVDSADAAESAAQARCSLRWLVRYIGLICVVQFGVSALGYSQLDSTVPLVATRLNHTGFGFVSLIVAANTVGVIVLQKPIASWLRRWSVRRGVQVAVGFFLGCYVVAGATSALGGKAPWTGLIVMAMVFACGEAAYASSSQPWLLASVPVDERTRASSLSNAAGGIGISVGPALGVLLMSTGQAVIVWASLAVGCAVVVLLAQCARTRLEGQHA